MAIGVTFPTRSGTYAVTLTTRHTESDEDPDLPVLMRVIEGDAESFGVLVGRHQESLWRLCERMLGDRDEARDAVQEIFLKAFRGASGFRPRGRVYTWLYRIAMNHCLNRLRRRKVVRFLSPSEWGRNAEDSPETPVDAWDPVDESPDAERRLRSRRLWNRISSVVDRLPASQKSVLVLAKFEGMSYRQIAEVLDITESAVESRLVRAMRRLTEAAERYEGEGTDGR